MVEFRLGAAAAAGLMGGGVMLVLLYGGIAMMPTRMRINPLLMLGGMIGLTGRGAYLVGLLIHSVLSVLFGLVHAAVFATGDIEALVLVWGLGFGAAHAAFSGVMLGFIPMMHPLVRAGRMDVPGVLGLRLGGSTTMGFVVLHLLFGAVVAVLYRGLRVIPFS